jgi:hypothetical protein
LVRREVLRAAQLDLNVVWGMIMSDGGVLLGMTIYGRCDGH